MREQPIPPPPSGPRLPIPRLRLAAFKSDRAQRPSQRSEADGVLRIFQQRTSALEMLMDLRPPEVILLGVLMLVPEVNHGS